MIIEHLVNYFEKKIEQGLIRNIDPEVAALNIFSIVFQIDIVWKIYDQKPPVNYESTMENFLEIFLNGILSTGSYQIKKLIRLNKKKSYCYRDFYFL